jgi:uncharacterized protein YlxW (UPF0749 family)
MKENHANKIKEVSNTILFIISALLTCFLFSNFSKSGSIVDFIIRLVWIALGATLEGVKLYQIMLLKGKIKSFFENKNGKIILSMIVTGVSYLGLTLVSVVASLGFCLLTLKGQSEQMGQVQQEFAYEIGRVQELNGEIKRANDAIDTLDAQFKTRENFSSWVTEEYETRRKSLTTEKQRYESERDRLNKIIEEGRKESIDKESVRALDVFDLLGEIILKTEYAGDKMAFFILMILIVILELTLFLTSDSIDLKHIDKEALQKSINKLETYINSLMDINGIRLNSDQKIEDVTGLTLGECKQFKKMLLNTKWKGKPLVMQGKGGTKANFPRETILAIMKNVINTEVDI